MRRFLIVNPFGIGDVLFTDPVIESIKADSKDVFIAYLCNKRTLPIVESNPSIDKVFVFEKDEYRALWKKSKINCIKSLMSLFWSVKKEKFDIVFDFSLSRDYGFLMMLAGIKKRIGYNYYKRGIFLTNKIPIENGYKEKHVVDYHLGLLSLVDIAPVDNPKYKVHIQPVFEKKAAEILVQYNIHESQFVCLMPGAGASWGKNSYRKQWPKENFLKVAKELISLTDLRLVLLGSGADREICDYIKSELPSAINLCSKTDLMSFAAIVEKANILITNDGGPLHIGVSVGTNTVSIFGPVNDKVYGPYTKDGHIVVKNNSLECAPCYKGFKLPECNDIKCLNDISPNKVIDAARELLKL